MVAYLSKLSMRFRMRRWLLFSFAWTFSVVANAQQKIPVQEGLEVNAVVSTKALNRIAVENDRVLSIKGTHGQFELDKDPELGQIFIKPLVKNKEELIHIFVTTENGHTYSLGLTTHALGAESIVLVPMGDGIAAKWEQSNSYESILKSIIKAMHTQTQLEGFLVENAKIKLPKIHGTQITHIQSYSGSKLLGEILEVTNTTNEALYLAEQEFYVDGIRAVSIVEKALSPKAKTRVYLIRG